MGTLFTGYKNTRPTALCVGAVPSLFGQTGADQREAQDGCQNGQLWLGGPLRAEGIPKRRCSFEFVAAQQHLSPSEPHFATSEQRPSNCEAALKTAGAK